MEQVFYIGVVEDINDPLKVGRIKVRVAGVHTSDQTILPTEDLPWAILNNPVSSASTSGIGDSPVGIVNGTWCTVVFLDPETKQIPMIFGTLSGLPSNVTEEYEYLDSSRGYDPETKRGYMDPQGIYPLKDNIDESDINRLARGEKLDSTILTAKENNRIKEVTEATKANEESNNDINGNSETIYSRSINSDNSVNNTRSNNSISNQSLTEHFTLFDFIKSDTATANNVDNYPTSQGIVSKLQILAQKVLEPIISHYNRVPTINSGYRGTTLNALVGGVSSSQHCKGEAVDIEIPGINNKELFQWISQNLEFDQLILEYATNIDKDPNSGWVHVSYNEGNNRNQVLIIGGEQNENTIGGAQQNQIQQNENTSSGDQQNQKSWCEPPSPYAAQYPYNHVKQSRSGHIFEVDDTPEHERIHEMHKSGTYYEIGPDGTKVTKIVKDNYSITLGDSYLLIEGNTKINIKGDVNILNEGNVQIENKKDNSIKINGSSQLEIHGNCETNIIGDCNTYVDGDYNLGVGGDINITSGVQNNIENSGLTVKSAGNIDLKGTIINLN